MSARDRIHAMLPPISRIAEAEAREQELNARLDALVAETVTQTRLADAAYFEQRRLPRERVDGPFDRGRRAAEGCVVEELRERAGNTAASLENYPGELAMLRGLLGVLRVTVEHGDLRQVQQLLHEHVSDEAAAYAEAGEAS